MGQQHHASKGQPIDLSVAETELLKRAMEGHSEAIPDEVVNNVNAIAGNLLKSSPTILENYNTKSGVSKFATGAIFGVCSGYAFRKAFRLGALVTGAGFVSLQFLQYYGYIDIRWKAIEHDITSQLDLNRDGRVDQKDLEIAKNHLMKILTWGLPSAGGFGAGFVMGFRGKFP